LEPLLISADKAFELIGVKRAKGYQMIKSGELPTVKIGNLHKVSVAQLKQWVLDRTEAMEGAQHD